MSMSGLINVRRFLAEQQKAVPGATGEFTTLLLDIILGCKKVGREIRRFGLSSYQHRTGEMNIQDEEVHALDELADQMLVDILIEGGQVCAVATEEREEIVVPVGHEAGHYVVALDPIDGFSNIETNVNVGTIFSVRRKISKGHIGHPVDFLRPGTTQVCAGYVMYGPSMVLVFTTGQGVHEFTYDPDDGEFILSRQGIQIPEIRNLPVGHRGTYSVNEGNAPLWNEKTRMLFEHFKRQGYSGRHIGSLVADFHRNLRTGGIFAYPLNRKMPLGKLRLLYELLPLAFIVEQAGGAAINGHQRIMNVVPTEFHQRSPVYIGSSDAVALVEHLFRQTE